MGGTVGDKNFNSGKSPLNRYFMGQLRLRDYINCIVLSPWSSKNIPVIEKLPFLIISENNFYKFSGTQILDRNFILAIKHL